jgi:hypothetical protein
MSETEFSEDQEVTIGLSAAEIKEVARRQFVASIAVAIVIAVGVGVAMLMPATRDYAQLAPHKLASVQQPIVAVPQTARVETTKKHELELP